jgi:hypothetical protein
MTFLQWGSICRRITLALGRKSLDIGIAIGPASNRNQRCLFWQMSWIPDREKCGADQKSVRHKFES